MAFLECVKTSNSLGHEGFLDVSENGLETAQLRVVVESVLLVLCSWLAGHVLSSYVLHDVAHVIVLAPSHFPALSDHHFVARLAKVLLVVNLEVFAALHPNSDFTLPAVA